MRQEVQTPQDLRQIPLTAEQARAIMELHERQASFEGRAMSLADLAETLDIPAEQARALYRESLTLRPRKRRSRFETFRLWCAALLLLLIPVLAWNVYAWQSRTRDHPASLEQADPVSAFSGFMLPEGFILTTEHGQGQREVHPGPKPVEWLATMDKSRLQLQVENAISTCIADDLKDLRVSDFPAKVTVTLSTEAGETSFKVRTLRSAFQLDRRNPSSKKVYEDVKTGVAKGWDKLIPPSVREKERQR